MTGTLEDVRDALARGANPSAFRGTKCLLVRALEHADPEEAVARTQLLLEAGANWNLRGTYMPIRQVFTRRLGDLLPVLANLDGALTTVPEGTDYLPSGYAAQDQWGEGLRILHSLGVDVRYAQRTAVKNPPFTSTLESWVAHSSYALPVDIDGWLATAQWLMEMPLERDEMPAARRGVLHALDRLRWKKAPHCSAFEALFEQHPAWMSATAARQLVGQHLTQLAKCKTMAAEQAIWAQVVDLVKRHQLSLSPGDGDHGFQRPPLEELLGMTAQHSQRPRRLKLAIERIEWALDHGATIADHHRGTPVWYKALRSHSVPWSALSPLLQRGLDVTAPLTLTMVDHLIENEINTLEHMRGSTALELLLNSSRDSFELLAGHFPEQLERRNAQGQTIVRQMADRNFKNARGDLQNPWDTLMFLQGHGVDMRAQDEQGDHFLLALLKNRTVGSDHMAKIVYHFTATAPDLLDLPNQDGQTPRALLERTPYAYPALKAWFVSQQLEQRLPQVTEERGRQRF